MAGAPENKHFASFSNFLHHWSSKFRPSSLATGDNTLFFCLESMMQITGWRFCYKPWVQWVDSKEWTVCVSKQRVSK